MATNNYARGFSEDVDIEIQTSDGKISLERSAFMFFGPPKIGKTNLASGWPNAVFLVTSEKEVKRLKVPYILVNSHKRLVAAVDYLIENRKKLPYRTVVFDFVDAMYTNAEMYICKKLKIEHQSEAGYGKGVGMIDNEFKNVMNKIIGSAYGCIFISHMQIKDVNTMNGVVTKTISTLPDRARRIIIPLVSVIGCIDFKEVKTKDPETGKLIRKQKRMISFEPSEYLEAGDRDGFLPKELYCFADPKKTYALIADYYSGRKKKGKDE